MPRKIYSFGAKHHKYIPFQAETGPYEIVDVRNLPNPFHDPVLRRENGLHPSVQDWMMHQPEVRECLVPLRKYLETFAGDVYVRCTGGRHRSVFVADRLGWMFSCPVEHLDINKP